MKILKVAKIVYTDSQMPPPQDLPQEIRQAKIMMQKPQSVGKFLCKSLGMHKGYNKN